LKLLQDRPELFFVRANAFIENADGLQVPMEFSGVVGEDVVLEVY
jgi:hypothetical protein